MLRRRLELACLALASLLLAGCETLSEPILVERVEIHSRNSVHVWADLNEEIFGGRYWSFTAYNQRSESVCVKLGLRVVQHNGYNYYDKMYLRPGQMVDMGYIREPSGWEINDGAVWSSDNSSCPE